MFKKLKDKITEEVKSSPQRFAEFTQSVSDKLQNSSTADDNVFSIGEDDANTSMNSTDHGFSSVNLVSPSQERVRRNSNSSMASDVSFLPRYESGSMYHLQSDLDDSVSEFEDSASTASSQLGHLSKEQIYSAFQKSQMRYHKYRGRYTDLARHYKDLEREVSKMKSVLVDTQDKAIRRVTELKEQCGLEQKAKAHLESALRDEMDEKNIKIQTLQTKIDLLQGGGNSSLLVDIDNKANNSQTDLDNLTKYLNDARKEIEMLNERIQEMKANSIVFQSKELEYRNKIASLEKEIVTFSERERENNLKLAQNKMELHNEILGKDTEISTLKKDNESLRQKLEASSADNKTSNNVKLDNLQTQNKKLIDKVENLSQKCNNLESELLKVEKYKMDIKELQQKEEICNKELVESSKIREDLSREKDKLQKVIDSMKQSSMWYEEKIKELSDENLKLKDTLTKEKEDFDRQISAIREDAKKGLLSLEPKIREKLLQEHLEREEVLKHEFISKIEELTSNNHSLKEMQMQAFEKDDTIKKLVEEVETLRNDLEGSVTEYCNLEKNHLELIEDATKLRNTISNLEKERSSLENSEEKISRLEAHISTLQGEVRALKDLGEKKEKENVSLSKENLNLQQELSKTSQKLRILEEKDEAIHLDSSESKLLELKLQKLEEERKSLLDEFELERKMFNDMLENHKDLKEKEVAIEELHNILEKTHHEIRQLSELLEKEREKNVMLFDKKHNLELQVTKLQEKVRIFEEKGEARDLEKSECGLLELKLQKLEEENKRLLQSFELERVSFANELEDLKQDLSNVQEQSFLNQSVDEASEDVLKEKLHQIRQLAEAKEKDNVFLSQENLTLQQEKTKLLERLRLVEEKLESIQMDGTESKLLELKVQKLEEENKGLLDEFEMERKMFNNLLENHKVVKEKEEVIGELEDILDTQRKEIIDIKERLEVEKHKNIDLQEKKLRLEEELRKRIEKVRILEEKEEAISLDKNECNLLEMKLQKLEAENKNLLETFEQERKIFNKAYHEHARTENQLKDLIQENLQIKEVIKTGKQKIEELNTMLKSKAEEYKIVREDNARYLKTIEELQARGQSQEVKFKERRVKNESLSEQLRNLNGENDKLKKEIEEKDKQVSELSKNIENLRDVTHKQTAEFNSLLERSKQLDSILEKMQIDSTEAIKKEKERQNELTSKIEDLQQELVGKTTEFANLSHKLEELEKLHSEEKNEYKKKLEEIQGLRKRVAELEALEESYKMIGEEKQVVDNELVRLKVLETKYKDIENEKISLESKLKQLESDFKTKHNSIVQKFKVTEQQCNILKEEKDNLMTELNNLRGKIEDLSLENSNFKATCTKAAETDYSLQQLKHQNEVLQNERDSLSKEISELNVRIGQISSDNHMIVGENQNLMHSNEELKMQLEFLDKEKDEFDEIKNKLAEERDAVTKILEDVRQELNEIQKQNTQLINDKSRASSNELDVSKIQQDFYEIKEKCDSLFVENKNLKSEYTKLEEKCNDFDKVKKVLETQINELENQYTEILHEKQLLQDEIQELKISPVNLKIDAASKLDQLEILKQEKAFTTDSSATGSSFNKETLEKQIEILQDKLVQYKSLDLTNKSSIDFYENELQKIKSQNEKLNRKLDETLVTLNHCAELSSSTEVEYLKNVLYNYMLGKEGMVLARVIAAVCKFDPQQTENVLQREQQKQTLLGQLGLI